DSGRVIGRVDKAHGVPFGEYVPFRSLLQHLVSLAAVPRDLVAGHGSGLLRTRGASFASLISYEAFFPDRARSGVRAGGSAILVATNTASYSSTQVPAQELAASRLDAIALGRDVLQAASVGYSAVIAPDGTVRAEGALGAPAVVSTELSLRRGLTFYADT